MLQKTNVFFKSNFQTLTLTTNRILQNKKSALCNTPVKTPVLGNFYIYFFTIFILIFFHYDLFNLKAITTPSNYS